MYKKGNYIAFMTKQPEVHLNVMFGYNDLTEADFEKTEYVARSWGLLIIFIGEVGAM